MAHFVFPLWGLVVFVLHMRGEFGVTPPECALAVRPWFGNKAACSLLHINCERLENHTGTVAEMDAIFDSIDEDTLAHIVIRHCPAVEISPRLQQFSSLVGMKIYNSTLVRWGEEAALTGAHHPRMVFVFIVLVNMSAFPDGLQSDKFPRQLIDVEIVGTNLTAIPDDLYTKWPIDDSNCGIFEQGILQTVPPMLEKLKSAYLSLVSNNISELPSYLFTNEHATTLWLNDNPIERLPEPLEPSRTIRAVRLANTRLQYLPTWMDKRFFEHARLVAGGTPFCEDLLAAVSSGGGGDGNATSPNPIIGDSTVSAAAIAAFAGGQVNCDIVDGDDMTYYPSVAEVELAKHH